MRRSTSWQASAFAAFVCLGLAIISIGSACTKNQRLSTIHATLLTVSSAHHELLAWDLEHERELMRSSTSREEALSKIADYEAERKKVEDKFVVVYQTIALAATQSDGPSLTAAMEKAKDLIESITKLRGGT